MTHKTARLRRDPPEENGTPGRLEAGDLVLYTIERPWIPTAPGGEPFKSCVPAGRYHLSPFTRANGDEVIALLNPGLGVFIQDDHRPNGCGRYAILFHSANFAKELAGCIAPGITQARDYLNQPYVGHSKKAMQQLMAWYAGGPAELVIEDSEQ